MYYAQQPSNCSLKYKDQDKNDAICEIRKDEMKFLGEV